MKIIGEIKICIAMEQIVIYLLFVKKTNNFKEKDSEIVAPTLILHISKDSSVDNIKKTGFKEYVYDFSVDYDAIVVGDILDIQKYLMKKNDTT